MSKAEAFQMADDAELDLVCFVLLNLELSTSFACKMSSLVS